MLEKQIMENNGQENGGQGAEKPVENSAGKLPTAYEAAIRNIKGKEAALRGKGEKKSNSKMSQPETRPAPVDEIVNSALVSEASEQKGPMPAPAEQDHWQRMFDLAKGGDKEGAVTALIEGEGFDKGDGKIREAVEKALELVDGIGKDQDEQLSQKIGNILKVLPEHENAFAEQLKKAGYDESRIAKVMDQARSSVKVDSPTPAPQDQGVDSAPTQNQEQGVEPFPLDDFSKEVNNAINGDGTPGEKEASLRDILSKMKEKAPRVGMVALGVVWYSLVTAVIAYIWLLKTYGKAGQGGRG